MRKLILPILTLAIFAAASILSAQAQKRAAPKKMQEVKIYLFTFGDENAPESQPELVAVKRKVAARSPLDGAFRALMAGASKAEEKRNLQTFIYGLNFVSARVKNKTAQVNFTSEEEVSWGEPMRSFFPKAVEKTALQFPGVKKVLICVDGISDFQRIDTEIHQKCP